MSDEELDEVSSNQQLPEELSEKEKHDLLGNIANHLVTMQSTPNMFDPPDLAQECVVGRKKRKIIPVGTQVLIIQNQIKLARRIFYLEFRTKLLNTIAELGIPMNYALQLVNCLDRYIPDRCTCSEDKIRAWILEVRLTPYERLPTQFKQCRI
jgi:hypothetical protein